MSPRQYVIALDIGGTGMKAALIDSDNRPLHEARRRTHAERGPDAVLHEVLEFAEDLRRTGVEKYATPPVAAGVAVPGVIDEATGTVTFAANLAWREVPLRSLLVERLGMPVALGHDVRTGGLAEGRLGAGEGTDRFLFVPIGTGIAGAIGIDGRVEPGAHGGAGEIGHVVVDPEGPECGCGQRGCLEALASAAAVGRDWAAVCGNPAATAADAAKAVASGDVRALAVWQKAVDRLAGGLVMACTLLDPRTLIVGGGLAEAGETLFAPLRDAVRDRVTFQHPPTIVPAALGDAAGCLGAGLLAWDLLSAEVSRR
ncbi:ROK family protein [Streptomyces sulphureus]|uniref:ROK family protein n=1 Tax=Streptomyces sulphureus TaxID=47758 RepID=UPI0003825AC1|nr:ROK family protein [Streptomyces sulphureus]